MTILFIFLAILTLVLSFYLGHLLVKIKKAKAYKAQVQNEVNEFLQKKEKDILESLRIISLGVTQDQCEISEGVIRIKNLLDQVDYLNEDSRFHDFKRIYKEFEIFPFLEEREKLSKQEKFNQDKERMRLEELHSRRVKDLCFELLHYLKPTH